MAETTNPVPNAEEHQQQRLAEASARVATAAIEWQRAQAAVRAAKKEFDEAVASLESFVCAGPEHLPLFDAQAEKPAYEPALEEGQCRVRILRADPESDVPEEFCNGALVVLSAPSDERLNDPTYAEGPWFMLDCAKDDYEVLEHWPDDEAMPTVHNPPLRFGPNRPDDGAGFTTREPPVDAQAWKRKLVSSLDIGKGTAKKLTDAGLATVGDLSQRMHRGHAWHRDIKGIGQTAADEILEAMQGFWEAHPEASE